MTEPTATPAAAPKAPTAKQFAMSVNARLEMLQSDLTEIKKELFPPEDKDISQEPVTSEAIALMSCIDALERLKDSESRTSRTQNRTGYGSYGLNSSGEHFVTWESGERILKFLADKFGVNLVEIRRDPCSREHIEEVSTAALAQAIASRG